MKISLILMFLLISFTIEAQIPFKTIKGNKANYFIEVPSSYNANSQIGKNVDVKYSDADGASIVTVVTSSPPGANENDIIQMANMPNQNLVQQLESSGLENISIINKGTKQINGIVSCFIYYRSTRLYHHVITQIVNGQIFTLTYTCDYNLKDSYMPFINRVVNSLKWKNK